MEHSPAAQDGRVPDRDAIIDGLARVRQRTLDIVSPLSDAGIRMQHSPIMSPVIWDLGHIAEFEDLWLVQRLGEVSSESALADAYDAMRTPRSARGDLDLPDRGATLDRLSRVRERAVARLRELDLAGSGNRLLEDGFVYGLVREHEAQHQETVLQTIFLMETDPYAPVRRECPPDSESVSAGQMIRVPAGEFEMGAAGGRFSYDNERPCHTVATVEYEIGLYPVTNGEYLEFIAAGGYDERPVWSDEGWAWKEEVGLFAPQYWRLKANPESTSSLAAAEGTRAAGASAWERVTSLGSEPVRPTDPVVHVCHHEAEAFARFAGCRLPTEAEWEKAAAWDPDSGDCRLYPWGSDPSTRERANLDVLAFGVAEVGAYPAGRSPVGCEQMLGDVWEWTSSRFAAYPGFEPYPYDDYSAVFFGQDYVVLRGSSWATDSGVARNTFRNWDYPVRRQIFAGLRLARDVEV